MHPTFPSSILDGFEVRFLVPIGFGIVIVGDGIEEGVRSSSILSADVVGHADDRTRIHASAQMSKDRNSRTCSAPDRLLEQKAEVLFVLGIRSVVNLIFGHPIPVWTASDLVALNPQPVSRRHSTYSLVMREIVRRPRR